MGLTVILANALPLMAVPYILRIHSIKLSLSLLPFFMSFRYPFESVNIDFPPGELASIGIPPRAIA